MGRQSGLRTSTARGSKARRKQISLEQDRIRT